MNLRRIGFLATRTTNYQPTADFFRDVLGLKTAWTKPDWARFRLPSGQNDFVEVYGPGKQDANLMPDSAVGPIVDFIVDDFASNPENLSHWASGLGQGVNRAGEHWEVQTQEGTVGLRFTPHNPYGVLDHTVVLSDGTEVYVPMRVMPNGNGSEVMLGLFRQPGIEDAEFARDAGLMQNNYGH